MKGEGDNDQQRTRMTTAVAARINNHHHHHHHQPHPHPHLSPGDGNIVQPSPLSQIRHGHPMTRQDQRGLTSLLRRFPISFSLFIRIGDNGGEKWWIRAITSTSAIVRSSENWNNKKGNSKNDDWSITGGEMEEENKMNVKGVASSSSTTLHLCRRRGRMNSSSSRSNTSSASGGSCSDDGDEKHIKGVPCEASSSFFAVNTSVDETGELCREKITTVDSVRATRSEEEDGESTTSSREGRREGERPSTTFTTQLKKKKARDMEKKEEEVPRRCPPALPPHSSQGTHPPRAVKENQNLKRSTSIPHYSEDIQYISQGVTKYKWVDSPGYGTQVLFIEAGDSVKNSLDKLGMPEGFPTTVAPGYKPFFYYSLVGASISNFSSAIGFQCLLSGFFLSSTPQLWVLKDLLPALLATYLANNVVSYENKPKKWYFISALFYNFTSIADIFISSLSADFMVFAAVWTSVLKQSSALMFLVTRSCALQHFAIGNNLGELTKQLNSFAMVIYTLASAAGTVFCYFVPHFYIQLSVAIGCLIFNQTLVTKRILSSIHYRILNLTTMTLLVDCYHHQRSLSQRSDREEEEEECEGGGGRKILSPEEVSRLVGMFEELPRELRGVQKLLYISPPLKKLVIHASTLHKDILFTSASQSFSIGLFHTSCVPLTWRESFKRRECPERFKMWKEKLSNFSHSFFRSLCCIKKFLRKEKVPARVKADVFHGKKLVLLVQVDCPGDDVIFGNYLLLTAMLRHCDSEESLRTFLRRCEQDEMNTEGVENEVERRRRGKKWREEGETFLELLKTAGWNITCPMLDHPDFRLKTMLRPPAPYN